MEDNFNHDLKDGFLAGFVSDANTQEAIMPITLYLRGIVITGVLIGVKEYFVEFGKIVAEWSKEPESKIKTVEFYSSIGDDMLKQAQENQKLGKLPHHLHMKCTILFEKSLAPSNPKESVLWRGRISEVSGFHLGFMDVSSK